MYIVFKTIQKIVNGNSPWIEKVVMSAEAPKAASPERAES